MKVPRFVALDARTGELVSDRAYRDLDELERDPLFVDVSIIPHLIAVDIAPPPLKVATLAADATLVVSLAGDQELEQLEAMGDTLSAVVGDRWLILDGERAKTAPRGPQEAPGAPERLPWSHYSPDLTTRLKGLVERFPHRTVADAAVTLADMIDEHGPDAVRERRAARGG